MKILIAFIFIFLTGCATPNQIVSVPPIQADPDEMKDCEDLVEPVNNSFKAFIDADLKNVEIHKLCMKQNEAKKKFILKITK